MKNSTSFFTAIGQFLISIFFLALFAIAVFRPDLLEFVINKIGEISHGLGTWNLVIITFSSFIESFPVIGVLVPGQQIMLIVWGFYGQTHFLLAAIGASIGAILGNWVGFHLGYHYGESFLEKYGDFFALGKTEQKILSKQIQKSGAWFVIFGKFHNFTRAFVPFLAGTFRMHPKRFWGYNILGSVIWAVSMLVLWVFFTKYIHTVLDYISWVFLGIFASIAIYIFFFRKKEFLEYLKEKEKELSL